MSVPATRPDVSIVMATFDREGFMPRAVDALRAQEGVVSELIVVDDCSTDRTPAVLAELRARWPDWIRVLRTPANGGPAVARNLGWRAARAPWVAFTDDDCQPSPGWLAALLAEADRSSADVVQGRTLPNPDDPSDGAWYRRMICTEFDHRFETCNLLVSRSVLEEIGGFDESFPFAGEDADCGWRALKAGARPSFAHDALVHHAVRPLSFRSYLRVRWGWGQLVRFYARHPEARFLLFGRVFHRRTHATMPLVVAALVAVALRSPRAAVALAAMNAGRLALAHRGTGRRPAALLQFSVLEPVATMTEVAGFVVGSARHRCVVL
jgi:GT2 family glycosyltransferase